MNLSVRPHLHFGLALLLLACGGGEDATTGAVDAATGDGGAMGDAETPIDDAGVMDAAVSPDQGVPPSPPGIGVTTIQVQGPAGRVLPTSIWYPTPPDTPGTPVIYQGFLPREAIQDAPIADGGPWPLIAFSHGNFSVKEQSVFLLEELARSGYIVVAPDHVGNTFFEESEGGVGPIMDHLRPLDITAVLDRILAPEPEDPTWLSDRVDGAKIGVTGHSRGGYTAVAVAGGELAVRDDYRAYCEATPDAPLCDRFDPAAAAHGFRDDRVSASMPMSPARYTLTPESLAAVEAPVLILTSLLDTSTPYDDDVRPIYDALSPPRALWTLSNGDHYTFSDLCEAYDLLGDIAVERFGDACSPDNPLQPEVAHPMIQAVALAFFDHALKGTEDTEGRLQAATSDELVILNDGVGR